MLAPFGQDATTGIQFIFTKHQSFIPCEEYIQCQKAQDTLNKAKESLRRLNDPSSVMHCKIVEGFVEKHGPDYDVAK